MHWIGESRHPLRLPDTGQSRKQGILWCLDTRQSLPPAAERSIPGRPGRTRGGTPRLLQQLAVARADGTYAQMLTSFAKVAVLVLDDFLLAPMTDIERRDLLEILEDRYDRSSTVITTQLPTKTWHQAIGEANMADAICDRLVHNAHLITLRGGSMRKKKAITHQEPTNNN